jgi:dTDP-4-amino-4,6-dideoxygalactose transaminase
MRVPFYRHQLGVRDADAVAAVLQSAVLTSGSICQLVEAEIAEFFGVSYALLVNSWTNGAAACLMAMDIGQGDEVIIPAMSFIATANVVEFVGATPVFVDVEPGDLMMSPGAISKALTPRTKAVIPVHLYGQMADMKNIRLAVGAKVKIIEDCAHCFEGSRDGARPGAYSDAAIFSFYATKNVTCGEGGALITRDPDLAEKFKMTRLHGMTAGAIDRYRNDTYNHWDMQRLGMKANLPDLLAALLPRQLKQVSIQRQVREKLAAAYNHGLMGVEGLRFQQLISNNVHAWHLFTICTRPELRDRLMTSLNRDGIGCTVNFRSIPTMSYYKNKYGFKFGDFPESDTWGSGVISLPFFPGLTSDEQDTVIASVKRNLEELT